MSDWADVLKIPTSNYFGLLLLWFCNPQNTIIPHTNHFKRHTVYREIYSQLKETLFSFHYSFLFFTSLVEWFKFCIPLTSTRVTYIILKNRIYVPVYYIWFWKVIYTTSRTMVWIKEHMFNLLILRYYIPVYSRLFLLRILPSLFLYLSMKQTTKFPAFFKLIIQNILHLEDKYYYLHLIQKFQTMSHEHKRYNAAFSDPYQSMI